ncbi:MAG: EF-hand domain-containing protein [Pseudomonadota bacterium]
MNLKHLNKILLVAAALMASAGFVHAAVDEAAVAAFMKMDTDKDGYVSVGEAIASEMSSESFSAADKNLDGKLDPDEYAAISIPAKAN